VATDDVVLVSATPEEAADPARILAALLDFGSKNRKVREGRPGRIEVRDAAVGRFIRDALGDAGLEVAVVPGLARIDTEIARIVEAEIGETGIPGVLDAPGVTVERLRAFADAASRCRAREVWHDIGPDDLVLVEAPSPPDGMAALVADPGQGGPSFRFYATREEFEREGEEEEEEDAAGRNLEDEEDGDDEDGEAAE